MRTIVIHRCATNNIGDRASNPALYFDLGDVETFDVARRDLGWLETAGHDLLVLGGGGLFYSLWEDRLRHHVQYSGGGAPVVVWGAGLNAGKAPGWSYPGFIGWTALAGMRETEAPFWVPCASCMSGAFDGAPKPTREFVIYDHCSKPVPLNAPGVPRSRNDRHGGMQSAVDFLAQGETVVTSSYHGAYWAALLGRRVVVFPWVEKFRHFRHRPGTMPLGCGLRQVLRAGVAHPLALAECREANERFYVRVKRLTGGP